jgi:sugar lactone lactonase YvrE
MASLWVVAPFCVGCGFSSEVASDDHDIQVVATDITSVDGLAFHPEGGIVAVEEESDGAVRRVDLETGEHQVIARLDTPDNVIVAEDGTIFVTQEISDGRIAKISPDGEVSTWADDLGAPEGLDRGPEGELYVAEHRADGGVYRIGADGTRERLATLQDGEGLRRLADGSLVVAETSDNRLARVFPDGAVRRLAEGELESPDGIGWDAARARLLVSEDAAPGRLLQVDPDSGEILKVVATGMASPQTMLFEADGSILISEQGEDRVLRLVPRQSTTAP